MSARLSRVPNWERLAEDAKFKPARMAARCSMSLRQLERFFVEQFGETPGQWARALRCRLALKLISSGWSNRAVVIELGFANESHLCHDVKTFCGASPQTFGPVFGASMASSTPTYGRTRPTAPPGL